MKATLKTKFFWFFTTFATLFSLNAHADNEGWITPDTREHLNKSCAETLSKLAVVGGAAALSKVAMVKGITYVRTLKELEKATNRSAFWKNKIKAYNTHSEKIRILAASPESAALHAEELAASRAALAELESIEVLTKKFLQHNMAARSLASKVSLPKNVLRLMGRGAVATVGAIAAVSLNAALYVAAEANNPSEANAPQLELVDVINEGKSADATCTQIISNSRLLDEQLELEADVREFEIGAETIAHEDETMQMTRAPQYSSEPRWSYKIVSAGGADFENLLEQSRIGSMDAAVNAIISK